MTPPRRFAGDIAALAHRLRAAGIPDDEAHPDARALVLHALELDRTRAALRSEPLSNAEREVVEPLLRRREARESVAHILGTRWFHGLEFAVDRRVLVPRPETELLVDTLLEYLAIEPVARVLEIGTGSGCIAISLAVRMPDVHVLATDISPDALEVARGNAVRHGVESRIEFRCGDAYQPVAGAPRHRAIVSNPPYIPPDQMRDLAPEVIDHDPDLALRGPGADGLGLVRRIAAGALERLAPGGLLAVEIGQGQHAETAAIFTDAGLIDVRVLADPAGIGRVVRGVAPRSR